MRTAIAAAATLAVLASGPAAAGSNPWGAEYFPNVELVTHDGKKVRFYDDLLKGKQVAINLIFTSCIDVCPLETANLARVYEVLGARAGRDIHFYSISIDPKRDTPEVLKAYREKFAAQWLFLTGRPEDIRLIGKKLGMIRDRDNPTSRGSHHAAYLMIGDEPNGQWTRHSAVDSPKFLAARMGSLLGWRDDPKAEKSYAEARPVTMPNGQRLFASKCSACHTVGQGDKVGPDLAGVTERRDRAWLARYIAAPEQMLAEGDPVAGGLFKQYQEVRMPNLQLGASDVADVIEFLETRAKPAREHPPR